MLDRKRELPTLETGTTKRLPCTIERTWFTPGFACYEFSRTPSGAGDKLIIEHNTNLELQVQSCLEGLGISLLSECDVLVFVYRRGICLANSDQIARLVGYESAAVGAALDRLEHEELIERSRPSQGVHFYRILASMDAVRWRYLRELVTLSESRAGRLLLTKQLRPVWPDSRPAASAQSGA